MKKFILLILVLSIFGTNAFAYDIEVKNADGVTIYYRYINDGTELAVTHRNSGEGSSGYKDSVVNIPESVTYKKRTYNVTKIGYRAFYNCSRLTSVTIPNSVTSIGEKAFEGCDLSEVISMIENPFDINTNTFSNNTFRNATLYVPVGTIKKYRAKEGWNKFYFIKEGNGSGNSIAQVRANAVLIQSENGRITVNGVNNETNVSVYNTNGVLNGTAISHNGSAVVNTSLQVGSVAIVKIGEKSVKVIIK